MKQTQPDDLKFLTGHNWLYLYLFVCVHILAGRLTVWRLLIFVVVSIILEFSQNFEFVLPVFSVESVKNLSNYCLFV